MREILFRGKTAKGEWVEGFYVRNVYSVGFAKEPTIYENHYIYSKNFISKKWFNTAKVEVIQETVGQFTGLTDKNGKKIFEGDIVITRYPKGDICSIGDVQFDSGVFGAEWTAVKENKGMVGSWGQPHNLRRFDDDIIKNIEVIGNIHDNPELLEAQNGQAN